MIRVFTDDTIRCRTKEIINKELSIYNEKEVFFVVPEYAKAQVERIIIDCLSKLDTNASVKISGEDNIIVSSSFVDGDVLSFIKLSSRILEMSGHPLSGSGDETILRNAIFAVLVNHRDEFLTFNKMVGRYEYINLLIQLLGDFTRYGIGPNELDKAIAKGADNDEYLKKLKDIKLLMEYIEEMNIKYDLRLLRDPIGIASELIASLDENMLNSRRYRSLKKFMKGRFVLIGFGSTRSLTPKERQLIYLLSANGADIDIFTIYPADENRQQRAFRSGQKFVDQMISEGNSVQSVKDFLKGDYATDTSDVLEVMTRYTLGISRADDEDAFDNIYISEVEGVDNQLGYIFDEVIRLTREEGYRYRDIRICSCDDALIPRMHSIAEMYGLDVFVDRKITLASTAIPFFAQVVVSLPRRGYQLDDVMKALRSGLVNCPPYVADVFDNYCHKKNITSLSRIFDPFSYKDAESDYPEYIRIHQGTISTGNGAVPEGVVTAGEFLYEHVVKQILIPLKNVADEIYEEKLLSHKADKLMRYLSTLGSFVEALRDELNDSDKSDSAVALVRGYDEMMSILSGFTHEMNDVEVDQKEFGNLLATDMRNKTEGTIPLKVDSVEITTPDRAFISPCKVMFLVGAKLDNFPYKRGYDGILSGKELEDLNNSMPVSLPDKSEVKSNEEIASCCLMLGTIKEKFYMVHESGASKSRVQETVEEYIKTENISINNYRTPVYGLPVEQRYDFKDASIPKGVMDELIGDQLKVSVTGLESYNDCPMKFMLDKILKIRQREDNTTVKSNQMGTLIHAMLEIGVKDTLDFCKTPEDYGKYASDLADDSAKLTDVTRDVFERSLKQEERSFPGVLNEDGSVERIFDMSQGIKARRIFSTIFPMIIDEISSSRFMPSGFEAKIGDNPDDIALSYDIDGRKYVFTGSIDRYDVSYDEENVYRIRDYKSGDKSISKKKLLEGIQIQLPAYSNALVKGKGLDSSSIKDYGYVLVGIKAGDKEYKLKNKVVADKELQNVPLYLDYADLIIRKSCENIAKGRACALAECKDSCKFCDFKGLCGNVASKPVTRGSYGDDKVPLVSIQNAVDKDKEGAKADE